jgi:NADPH:quinone reductase-like Zn-dependent oxidoreductase
MEKLLLLLPMLAALSAGAGASADASMLAAVTGAGSVHVLSVARPVPKAGQVLVQLHFAGVNPDDWRQPQGAGAAGAATVPIPGSEGSGVIVALGVGVRDYRVGDAVILWSHARGAYAQYLAVPVQTVFPKPASMSFEQAASLAQAGIAAWNMLIDIAHVRAGQTVLILGDAGGVGSAALQIAKNKGAHVIATAPASGAGYLSSLGADQVIDYTAQHFEDQVRNADIVLNTLDADNAYRGLAVLKAGGFLVSLDGLPTLQQCAARTVTCANRTADTPERAVLEQLAGWSSAGRYRIDIGKVFRLSEIIKAWGYSQGDAHGKSVIRTSE